MLKGKIINEFQNENDAEKEKNELKTSNSAIVIALALSLLLVFVTMTANFKRTYQNVRNDVIELSKSSSVQNAESIETFFSRHEDILLASAEVVEYTLSKESADKAEIQELLRNLSEEYNETIYKRYTDRDFTGVYASVNGELIHAYKTDADLPEGYDPTKRLWYNEGMEGGGTVVFGEPYYDVYDPEIQVMTATKLLSDGKTVIGMDITLDDMQYAGGNMDVSVTLDGKRHEYGHGFILTAKGVVMAHKNKEEQGKNYNASYSPMHDVFKKIKECADSENDYMETEVDGVNCGIFPHKLENGWYVVTLTDLEDIRTTISDFAVINLVATALIILLGAIYCFFILKTSIKAQKLAENLQGTLRLAKIDSLTNLGNRTAYDMRVRELRERMAAGNDISFVLIMMDLNDLKYVNDHYGHAEGDKYILNCCNLVSSIFTCEIYRIGGDEFALFLTDEVFEHWEELFDCLKLAVAESNMSLTPDIENPSIAIGLAIHTVGNSDNIEDLLRKADAEMYTNKVAIKQARLEHSEKGYAEDLKLKLLDKQMLASEMKKGLEEEQFEIWFQPQVNNDNNGSLIGAEALVRWNHPVRGIMTPEVFIPLFEYNGIIYELDKYVWRHACAHIRRELDDGRSPLPISVNVSRLDIIQEDFVETIVSIVQEQQIPYNLLHLEITESAFSDETCDVAEIVNELISHGFIIAIDDFGTGYSSLSLLRNVEAHIVKLDMRFFTDGKNQTRNECIIESIVRMVKMLGMAVIAEGIEYKEQADLLHTLGCAYVQGWLYSKPLPYDEYIEYTKTMVNEIIDRPDNNIRADVTNVSGQPQNLFHSIISGTNDVIIVTDNKTRQLLYANRAAEKFFGKRFDPLNPTTCMQYCEKEEMCKNCPASNMKQGERREFVSSENGCYIKSLYAQMDWNGHDAVVIYQTDISAEMREMEHANTLMNNLGVGIIVFRGDTPDEIIPVFINKEYMKLSGLSREEAMSLLTKNSLYGVHPDDIAKARIRFAEAYKSGQAMQCHIRVQKSKGGYEWVSMHAKIKHLETGGFEAYMIFSDAEKEIKKRSIEAERYESFIEHARKTEAKALSIVHLNLTKNICHSIYRDVSVNRPAIFEKGTTEFIASVAGNIANDKIKAEFVEKFSPESLLKSFEQGRLSGEMHIPVRLTNQKIIWCYQFVNISKNPETDDIEAVMNLTEADKDIRLAANYKRLINADYEFVGNIDVQTGLLTVISEPNDRGIEKIGDGAIPYVENLASRIAALVDSSAVNSCIEALSLNTVYEKLKTQDIYTCTFPANKSLITYDAAFQWRFGYADKLKTEILFSRREIQGVVVK